MWNFTCCASGGCSDSLVFTNRGGTCRPLDVLRDVVSNSNFFAYIDPDKAERLVESFGGPMMVSEGTIIMHQGEKVDTLAPAFFVLIEGVVDCMVAKGDEEPPGRVIFTFKQPGQAFGQVALLYDCPRTATLVARQECQLWHLDRQTFLGSMDENRILRIVERHRETVGDFGMVPQSLADKFGIFDISLIDDGLQKNLNCYYNMIKSSQSLIATLSCFANWNKQGKINSAAKVIPALPVSRGEEVRIFFFDDNIEWDGKADSQGICNLRNLDTLRFVDFAQGCNGYVRSNSANYTVVHHSTEFKTVLVKANILDAMESPEYFIDIINSFAMPGEKIVAIVDINSTILCSDSVSSKSMSSVILGTMFEFISAKAQEPFLIEWEAQPPVKVNGSMTLKQIVKKISNADKTYYDGFYHMENCMKLLGMVLTKGIVTWSNNSMPFSLDNFKGAYRTYLDKLVGSTNDIGLSMSWFTCYHNLLSDGHSIVLNSFGTDVRQTIVKTVPDEREVLHVAVDFEKWGTKDVENFETTYELSSFGRQMSIRCKKNDSVKSNSVIKDMKGVQKASTMK